MNKIEIKTKNLIFGIAAEMKRVTLFKEFILQARLL